MHWELENVWSLEPDYYYSLISLVNAGKIKPLAF